MEHGSEPSLCDYCAAIEFDHIRRPTVKSIQRLNQGEAIYGELPFKFDTAQRVYPSWNLGTQQRIDESAASCPLCRAIVAVMDQADVRARNPAMFADNSNPPCQVEAHMCWSARLLPPPGTAWKIPDEVKSARHQSEVVYYLLRPVGLTWYRFVTDGSVEPELLRMGRDGDPKPRLYAYLDECFQSYDGEYPVAISDLFSDERLEPSRTLFGGRRRPPFIDLDLPRRWLGECLGNHSDSCGAFTGYETSMVFALFRLIDVNRNALVEFQSADLKGLRYAALSYLWGATQRLQLRRANVQALRVENSLTGRTSRTIRDAITFTRKMGLPYLWVDALCIIQNDDVDKAAQIRNMGNIYKYALFTVVAGAGHDAGAGLPGLDSPRTKPQHDLLVRNSRDGQPPIRLLSTLTPRRSTWAHYTAGLPWSSRGWTLQEKALSRRVLTFTDQQLFWACRSSHWCEEQFLETSLARTKWLFTRDEMVMDPSNSSTTLGITDGLDTNEASASWHQLKRLVQDFGERRFTVPGDVHDAFSAILQECSLLVNEPFIWGLPASARFELALCWEPFRESLQRRSALTTLPTTSLNRKVPFPSWSWMGWAGAVLLRVEDKYADEGIDPQVLCYVLRNSPVRLARVSRLAADNAAAVNATTNSPFALSLEKIHAECPELTQSRLSDTPDDQLLFFWAETCSMTVVGPAAKFAHQNNGQPLRIDYFDILDSDGEKVGSTSPCKVTGTEDGGGGGGGARVEGVEFVAIADNRPLDHPPHKIALQIERRDGVAYRVNIAEIREDAWNRSGPKRALIALD